MSNETPRNLMTKTRALRVIMATLFPTHLSKPKTFAELDLRFGDRLYARAVRCQILWRHPDASMSFDSTTTWAASRSTSQLLASINVNAASDEPVLAYISRSNLDHIRRNCFRIVSGPNRSYNGPVHRLQSLRSKRLMPSNPDEDQYFVAVAIAMAQRSVYPDGLKSNVITYRDVKVRLFTVSEEDEAFIVYTATVPAGLLEMFHEPHQAPRSSTRLQIEYTHVPVWPVLGLKERLGLALGRDIVGEFDELHFETFDEEELVPLPEPISPQKRRREVLSEVLGVSFTKDTESDDPIGVSSRVSKRRCLEEGRVGLVR